MGTTTARAADHDGNRFLIVIRAIAITEIGEISRDVSLDPTATSNGVSKVPTAARTASPYDREGCRVGYHWGSKPPRGVRLSNA